MMTTFEHLELAIIELADAKRMAEFNNWPSWYVDRIDLVKRATANVKARMLNEANREDGCTGDHLLGAELFSARVVPAESAEARKTETPNL